MRAERAVVEPVNADVVVLDLPVQVVVDPVVAPLVDHAVRARSRAGGIVSVTEGAQNIEQDLVRRKRVHLRLMVMEPVILINQAVEVVVHAVVCIRVDIGIPRRIGEDIPFDDLRDSGGDLHRQTARVKHRVGRLYRVRRPREVIVDENDLLSDGQNRRVKVGRREPGSGDPRGGGIGVAVVVDPVIRIAGALQKRVPHEARPPHPEGILHGLTVDRLEIPRVRDILRRVIERPVVVIFLVVLRRGHADVRPDKHAEDHLVVRRRPGVRDFVEPENVVLCQELRPLERPDGHDESHPVA